MNDEVVRNTAAQLRAVEARLKEAKINSLSPKGIVRVVHNGFGETIDMTIKPGATRNYAADSMSGFVTSAMRAGDRAVQAIHQHSYNNIQIGDDTARGWRANPDNAVAFVVSCFSATSVRKPQA